MSATRSLGERFGERVLLACAVASVALAAAVIGVVGVETVRFFGQVSPPRFFGDFVWAPWADEPRFGVLGLVAGTAWIGAMATSVALPVGLLIALFLTHSGKGRAASILNGTVTSLSCIPAVVYGYLVWPGAAGLNGLSACLAVAVMILPTIVALSRDALAALPGSLIAEGMALGASRSRVLMRVVVPAARSGVLGAAFVAMARAMGETMIVTLVAGSPASAAWNPLAGVRTLTTILGQASLGDIPTGSIEYGACFAVVGLLFLLTFATHGIGRTLVSRTPHRVSRASGRAARALNREGA